MAGGRIWHARFAVAASIAMLVAYSLPAQYGSSEAEIADGAPQHQLVVGTSDESAAMDDLDEFLNMDLEQLRHTPVAPALGTVVTTVSRQESTVGKSPAAVFVITQAMIRRSGARSFPEMLRMVPGLNVAKIDSNKWAISARGFSDRCANKLLVQIDGRSVYTPLFAGVYWDVQDLLLEDVERIEVIRGPGATVWGANAVNGVINIITKRARDTVGIYVNGGGGTEEAGFSGVRVGGAAADGDLHWRVWGKWFERDNGFRPGAATFDDWRQGRGGFRTDWTPNGQDTVVFQGDCYEGRNGGASEAFGLVFPNDDVQVQGGNLLARWSRQLDDSSDWSLLFYWDRAERVDFWSNQPSFDQRIDTIDVDFQHRMPLGRSHRLIWGLGYRHVSDNLISPTGAALSFAPPRRKTDLFNAFVQDQIALIDDRLFFTIGTKLEHNAYTGVEVQPTARLLWSPDPTRSAWASVSRAVRTPSRADDDLRMALGGPLWLRGSRDVEAEELLAYEIGYRSQPEDWFSWDVTLFCNVYDDLVTQTFIFPNLISVNDMRAETYGVELFGQVDITPCWRLSGSYTFLSMYLHPGPTSFDSGVYTERSSPRNQAVLWSSWDLRDDLEFDVIARYVDRLPARTTPHYITMDVRLAWRPRYDLELAVVGQNLLDGTHQESNNDFLLTQYTEVQRGVYGSLTWRY